MRLRQQEFCHNCHKYVTFEFDDVTERQVIICPNCKHEHWRELDEGTIINIRTRPGQQEVHQMKMPPLRGSLMEEDSAPDAPIQIEVTTHRVVGQTEDGRAIVEDAEGEKTKVVSDRRWGRDPRQ